MEEQVIFVVIQSLTIDNNVTFSEWKGLVEIFREQVVKPLFLFSISVTTIFRFFIVLANILLFCIAFKKNRLSSSLFNFLLKKGQTFITQPDYSGTVCFDCDSSAFYWRELELKCVIVLHQKLLKGKTVALAKNKCGCCIGMKSSIRREKYTCLYERSFDLHK